MEYTKKWITEIRHIVFYSYHITICSNSQLVSKNFLNLCEIKGGFMQQKQLLAQKIFQICVERKLTLLESIDLIEKLYRQEKDMAPPDCDKTQITDC